MDILTKSKLDACDLFNLDNYYHFQDNFRLKYNNYENNYYRLLNTPYGVFQYYEGELEWVADPAALEFAESLDGLYFVTFEEIFDNLLEDEKLSVMFRLDEIFNLNVKDYIRRVVLKKRT